MDVSQAIVARSDQINAIDLLPGERTVTILEVKPGSAEQPVVIVTDVFGPSRPFKPSKTALRVIVGCWGSESTAWIGRRMTIYRDPNVRWAGEPVGGIRISALSHIDQPQTFSLAVSKGKNAKTTVQPLPDAPVPANQVSKAVTAVHGATSTVELDKIVDYARKLGIDGADELVAAIGQKRSELGGDTIDRRDGVL